MRPGLNSYYLYRLKALTKASVSRGLLSKNRGGSLPGYSKMNYFTVPRSFTVMAVAGMASMASDTVISPLNILATRSL